MKMLFIDCETLGTNENEHPIVEVSFAYMDVKGIEKKKILMKPNKDSFEERALEIMGLSIEDLYNRTNTSNEEAFSEFISYLDSKVSKFDKKDKITVFAYNENFDNRFLRTWFLENGNNFFGSYFWNPWIDVMSLAANKLLLKRAQLPNFKLSTVCEFMGIEVKKENLHGALYDVQLCMSLYEKISS